MGDLEHTVRTGGSAFEHVHGMPFFQFFRSNADIQQPFDEAMARISDSDDSAIASAYDFKPFHRIVDVGGSRGGFLVQVLKRAPATTGILPEQPQVLDAATRPDEAGLANRVVKAGGNFSMPSPIVPIAMSSKVCCTILTMTSASKILQ